MYFPPLPSESPPAEDLVVSQRRGKDQVRWVCRIGAPFAQLIIGGAKVLETRVVSLHTEFT